MHNQPGKENSRTRTKSILPQFMVGIGLVIIGIASVLILINQDNFTSGQAGSEGVIPREVDYPAPELSLLDIAGRSVDLSDYHGQVVLVNNWATWCPPCREEMPALQAYHDIYKDKGFSVVAVEAGEPAEQVQQFVDEYGLTFPVWVDVNQQALAVFRNMALPNSYVIDRKGQVRLAWNGAISQEGLEKYVTPLVEE